jgi:hypothetical protein
MLGPFGFFGILFGFPPRDRVGEFVAAVSTGAAVGEPAGGAERTGVERVVGTVAVDQPGVAWLVAQVVRFVARARRVGVRCVEVAQIGTGLVAVGARCHRVG